MAEIERQFNRSFSFSETAGSSSGGISAYEDFDGQVHSVGDAGPGTPKPVPLVVRKSWYQATPGASIHVGDMFGAPGGLSARCTSVEVSDEILRFYSDRVVRLWQVTVEGITQPDGEENTAGMTVKRLEWDVSEEINGSTARTLSGRLVALLKSTVPRRKVRVSASGTAPQCPATPGTIGSFSGISGLVTGTTLRRRVIEGNGAAIATIYDYTIDLEV